MQQQCFPHSWKDRANSPRTRLKQFSSRPCSGTGTLPQQSPTHAKDCAFAEPWHTPPGPEHETHCANKTNHHYVCDFIRGNMARCAVARESRKNSLVGSISAYAPHREHGLGGEHGDCVGIQLFRPDECSRWINQRRSDCGWG